MKNKIKRNTNIGVLCGEFFDKRFGGYGGYGMLVRKYLTEAIFKSGYNPITLIGYSNTHTFERYVVDTNKTVIRFPLIEQSILTKIFRKLFKTNLLPFIISRNISNLRIGKYFLIEDGGPITEISLRYDNKPFILWLQDPRTMKDWDEIRTLDIASFEENRDYYQKISTLFNEKIVKGAMKIVSQADFLKNKGREIYKIPDSVPIEILHNPVEIPNINIDEILQLKDKKKIIFLGRLDPVKRPWIFLELSKYFPEYEFHVCGIAQRDNMIPILEKYKCCNNVYWHGHIDGEEKKQMLLQSSILINTSIHEALPVSFLEALSYGTLLVSNQNPDNLTSKFGVAITEPILGDGISKIDYFINSLRILLDKTDNELTIMRSEAINYIKTNHSFELFTEKVGELLKK